MIRLPPRSTRPYTCFPNTTLFRSDEKKWRQWFERFDQNATGNGDRIDDMTYLRHSFVNFDDFAKAVELLRSSSFEALSNKRWCSKFVFPFGPDALYEDLTLDSKGKVSNERRFFARSRSEEHTYEIQSLMPISYAVLSCK